MLRAYVGVASKHGLSVFKPEQEEALSQVRQCVQHGGRRVAFWAVIKDADARAVQALFARGLRREALMALDRTATDLGRITPH